MGMLREQYLLQQASPSTLWRGTIPMTTTPDTSRDIAVEQAEDNASSGLRVVDGVALPAPGTYVLDPTHTRIGFVARHLMVTKVRGRFAEFEGSITVGDDATASTAQATMKTLSI